MQGCYVCKNCGEIISPKAYKKQKDLKQNAKDFGCFIWLIVLVCFVSVILIPIAIILLLFLYKNEPKNECPFCGAKDSLIPASSPIAQRILNENYETEKLEEIEDDIKEETKQEQGKLPLGCIVILCIMALYLLIATIIAVAE